MLIIPCEEKNEKIESTIDIVNVPLFVFNKFLLKPY